MVYVPVTSHSVIYLSIALKRIRTLKDLHQGLFYPTSRCRCICLVFEPALKLPEFVTAQHSETTVAAVHREVHEWVGNVCPYKLAHMRPIVPENELGKNNVLRILRLVA